MFVLLCVLGFSGLYAQDYFPENTGEDAVTFYPVLLTDSPSISAELVDVCVHRGKAKKGEITEFSDCITESKCKNWEKFKDEKTKNVAMVCRD